MEKQSIALMYLAVLLATFCVTQGSVFPVGAEILPGKKKKKIPYVRCEGARCIPLSRRGWNPITQE